MTDNQVISYFTLWKLSNEDHQITEVPVSCFAIVSLIANVVDCMAGILEVKNWIGIGHF